MAVWLCVAGLCIVTAGLYLLVGLPWTLVAVGGYVTIAGAMAVKR